MAGFWGREPMPLDFLVIGRGYGLSVWQTQRLWEQLSNDPRYFLAQEPDQWVEQAFRQEAAAMRDAKRAAEQPDGGERGAAPEISIGKLTLVDQVYGRAPLWPRPTAVGKRTLVEEVYGGKGPMPTSIGKRTLVQDLPAPKASKAPVATELPFRAEVEALLGISLSDVRAYTHQDELLSPHGARAAAFPGGVAFAGTPTKTWSRTKRCTRCSSRRVAKSARPAM